MKQSIFIIFLLSFLSLSAVPVQAQGYEGVMAGDGDGASSSAGDDADLGYAGFLGGGDDELASDDVEDIYGFVDDTGVSPQKRNATRTQNAINNARGKRAEDIAKANVARRKNDALESANRIKARQASLKELQEKQKAAIEARRNAAQ